MIKILLVEDNIGDARFLEHMLLETEPAYFELTHVDRLSEAIGQLNRDHFDIAILDLSLPDSTGLETVLKLHNQKPKLPIIVLTGFEDETHGLSSLRKGAQDYLVKGQITQDLFSRTIHYAIERNRLKLFRDQLVGQVSHELRTPLTVIREGISQVVDGIYGPISIEQKKCLDMTLRNVDRLGQLMDRFLDISRTEDRKIEIFKRQVDIVGLAKGIISNFTESACIKGLQLKQSLPERLEVCADPERITQVLRNLVDNALRFTDAGSVEVMIEEYPNRVECAVADTGVGIFEEDLPKVFNQFEQLSPQNPSGQKGTVLSLSLCRRIVELHDGQMRVESKLGQGAKFIFTLPKLQ